MNQFVAQKYYFTDFTLNNSEHLLALASKSQYRFITYGEFSAAEKQILMCHDVDYSIDGALEIRDALMNSLNYCLSFE